MSWFKKLFKKSDTTSEVVGVFRKYYAESCGIMEKADVEPSLKVQLDLAGLIFTAVDYAVVDAGLSRSDCINAMLSTILSLSAPLPGDIALPFLKSRIAYYGNIITGGDFRSFCGDVWKGDDVPSLGRCVVAFTDHLLLPELYSDINATAPLFDAFDIFCMHEDVLNPLCEVVISIVQEVHAIR